MKFNWKTLILFILMPLAVGGASALFTMDSMMTFEGVAKQPLSPPGWLFPVVWTVLYTLMGIASYLVYASDAPREQKNKALWLYGIQLVVNFFWSPVFFNLQAYLFAFIWLVVLWILILFLRHNLLLLVLHIYLLHLLYGIDKLIQMPILLYIPYL